MGYFLVCLCFDRNVLVEGGGGWADIEVEIVEVKFLSSERRWGSCICGRVGFRSGV